MVQYPGKVTKDIPRCHGFVLEMSERMWNDSPHFLVMSSVGGVLENHPTDAAEIY